MDDKPCLKMVEAWDVLSRTSIQIGTIQRRIPGRQVWFARIRIPATPVLLFLFIADSLLGTSVKIGTIQRRLAWPLRKDDTQNREAFHIFVAA